MRTIVSLSPFVERSAGSPSIVSRSAGHSGALRFSAYRLSSSTDESLHFSGSGCVSRINDGEQSYKIFMSWETEIPAQMLLKRWKNDAETIKNGGIGHVPMPGPVQKPKFGRL
jgi:hypothetical protein